MAIETGKDATFALLLFKLFKSMAEREGRTRLRNEPPTGTKTIEPVGIQAKRKDVASCRSVLQIIEWDNGYFKSLNLTV